jgi:hypothetical protein
MVEKDPIRILHTIDCSMEAYILDPFSMLKNFSFSNPKWQATMMPLLRKDLS